MCHTWRQKSGFKVTPLKRKNIFLNKYLLLLLLAKNRLTKEIYESRTSLSKFAYFKYVMAIGKFEIEWLTAKQV